MCREGANDVMPSTLTLQGYLNLKTLKIKSDPNQYRFRDDEHRIQEILFNRGYTASLDQCRILWGSYSDTYAAGWLFLHESDDAIFDCIKPYIEDED